MNMQQEIVLPDCLHHLRGKRGENNFTAATDGSFSLSFGKQSNEAALAVFNQYTARLEGVNLPNGEEPKNYLEMIEDFDTMTADLDKPFSWGQA